MLVLLFLVFGFVQSQNDCEYGWTEYNRLCYRHFDNPDSRHDFTRTRSKCQALGGELATGAKRGEREFMYKLGTGYPDYLLAGVVMLANGTWASVDPTETVEIQGMWCQGPTIIEPDVVSRDHCTLIHHDIPLHRQTSCLCNGNCVYLWRRYMCRKPKPLVCTGNIVAKGGKCICKEGYVDIRETDDLDKNKYKELVDFVKSAANLLPNQVNAGFIKFSTKVSFAEWLPTKWSRREFEQMVPEDFDAGYTNTPAAIEKAIEMFDEDRRQTDKVAVLITDGLPVIDEQTDKDKGLTDTRAAISKLQRRGVDIVALGFGPELRQQRGDTYIKKWLSDPEEDYFSFDRMACDLRKVHMQMLLQKVCRRYV